jgi:hypothetical protein
VTPVRQATGGAQPGQFLTFPRHFLLVLFYQGHKLGVASHPIEGRV